MKCAKILNSRKNIQYRYVSDKVPNDTIDLVYSFAVVQHVPDEIFRKILRDVFSCLKPGGKIVFDVVLSKEGWQSESELRSDKSVKGRIKLKYALNCFSRTEKSVIELAEISGFVDIHIIPTKNMVNSIFDDICEQHLLVAERPI